MPMLIKVLIWTLVIGVSVVVLFTWVFPWVESLQQDPTLGAGALRWDTLGQVIRSPR